MGDDFGTVRFGVMSEGGYVPVGVVDQAELSVASLFEDELQSYQRETLRALRPHGGEITLDLAAVGIVNLFDEIGRSQETRDEMTVCLEQSYRVFERRHKFVWQYRRERKGNKANRRKRGRWRKGTRRTVLPDVVVSGIRQPLSDQAFAPVEVAFERSATA